MKQTAEMSRTDDDDELSGTCDSLSPSFHFGHRTECFPLDLVSTEDCYSSEILNATNAVL